MKSDAPVRLRFASFTLDLRRRGLYRGPERIHLTAKPLETLVFLVEHRDRVVSKEELLDAVWRDTVVTEGVLVQAIREIRRVLHDNKDDPAFVLTVPREGYRFIASVTPEGEGGQETAAAPRPARTLLYTAALLVVAAAGGVAMLTLVRSGHEPLARIAGLSEARKLTSGPLSTVKPAFSPDGRWVVFAGDLPEERGAMDLYLVPAGGGTPVRLTTGAEASGDLPVFTADGNRIVFARRGLSRNTGRLPDLWSVSREGGTPALFLRQAAGAGFSPDGRFVAYTKHLDDRRPLWISATDRLQEHREAAEHGYTPRWSPDGRWIAYTTSSPEGGKGDVWLISASLETHRRLTTTAQQLYGLTWTSDGLGVIYAADAGGGFHLFHVSADGGAPVALTSGVGQYSAPSASPDGTILAFAHLSEVRDLQVASSPGTGLTNITTDEYHSWPALSPSGDRAASVIGGSVVPGVLCVTDVVRGTRLFTGRSPATHPSWMDENHIAYLSPLPSAGTAVRVLDLVTHTDDTLTSLRGAARWLAVSPGGDRLAVVLGDTETSQQVLVRDLRKGTDRVVARGGEFAYPAWSPQGLSLAWSGPATWASGDANGIWIVNAAGGEPRRLVSDGFRPAWDRDEGTLYFAREVATGADQPAAGLWEYRLDDGRLAIVRDWRHLDDFDVRGGRLLFTLSSGQGRIYTVRFR